MGLEEFFREVASDQRLREAVDRVFSACSDSRCGKCIARTVEHYYLKWLFTRRVDPAIAEDLRKCVERGESARMMMG